MTYCPHDDDPQSCPPCQNGTTARQLPTAGPVFAARHHTRCPDCLDPIEPNEEARMVGDRHERAAWHRTCADTIR